MAKGRKTGGRQLGSRNKATVEIKALAQKHTPAALEELARLATKAQSETARVAAIKELLDRGHGKAPVQVDVDGHLSGKWELTWKSDKSS